MNLIGGLRPLRPTHNKKTVLLLCYFLVLCYLLIQFNIKIYFYTKIPYLLSIKPSHNITIVLFCSIGAAAGPVGHHYNYNKKYAYTILSIFTQISFQFSPSSLK